MSRYDDCGAGAGTTLFAFILGAIVGGGIVALLSPTTGPENRRRLTDLKEDLIDKSFAMKDEAMDKYGGTIDKVEESLKTGKEFIKNQKGVLSSAIEAGKEAFMREKETGSADEDA